jgi:Cof subfamily protein (haloacid dehalogenase superfamily)
MRYRMIAIDLDGTLLDSRNRVSEQNIASIKKAQDAGVIVVPCTGRGWREAKIVLECLQGVDLGVFVTGAVVGKVATGESLNIAVIEPSLAEELVRFLEHLPEAILVYRDASMCGHDYLVTGPGTLTPATQWWFEATGATVHFHQNVTKKDLNHTLRVGALTTSSRVPPLIKQLRDQFSDRTLIQSFEAVRMPTPEEGVHILEIFAAGVDKWRGLNWIANQHGIQPQQIAAIGDEINDLAMLESVGCGIAMANAVEPVKAIADHLTSHHDDDGVAYAIERLLAGDWG